MYFHFLYQSEIDREYERTETAFHDVIQFNDPEKAIFSRHDIKERRQWNNERNEKENWACPAVFIINRKVPRQIRHLDINLSVHRWMELFIRKWDAYDA